MSNLSSTDKKYLDNALRLDKGWIIRFSDETFREFFSQFNINIDDAKYSINGTTKAQRMEAFWNLESNQVVGMAILELAAMFRNRELAWPMNVKFSGDIEKIGNKLLTMPNHTATHQSTPVTIDNNLIHIEIRPEIYTHIKRYLDTEDYFHAVEESYKVVRDKLRSITNQEQAHKAFAENNYEKIFGHAPKTDVEKDFFEGTKFLHMALQNFRNEKAHSLAGSLDRNLAIHYLSLASLAYDLISRKVL